MHLHSAQTLEVVSLLTPVQPSTSSPSLNFQNSAHALYKQKLNHICGIYSKNFFNKWPSPCGVLIQPPCLSVWRSTWCMFSFSEIKSSLLELFNIFCVLIQSMPSLRARWTFLLGPRGDKLTKSGVNRILNSVFKADLEMQSYSSSASQIGYRACGKEKVINMRWIPQQPLTRQRRQQIERTKKAGRG